MQLTIINFRYFYFNFFFLSTWDSSWAAKRVISWSSLDWEKARRAQPMREQLQTYADQSQTVKPLWLSPSFLMQLHRHWQTTSLTVHLKKVSRDWGCPQMTLLDILLFIISPVFWNVQFHFFRVVGTSWIWLSAQPLILESIWLMRKI